jgi:hypothetical protein
MNIGYARKNEKIKMTYGDMANKNSHLTNPVRKLHSKTTKKKTCQLKNQTSSIILSNTTACSTGTNQRKLTWHFTHTPA